MREILYITHEKVQYFPFKILHINTVLQYIQMTSCSTENY